jgi:hypothetical protein
MHWNRGLKPDFRLDQTLKTLLYPTIWPKIADLGILLALMRLWATILVCLLTFAASPILAAAETTNLKQTSPILSPISFVVPNGFTKIATTSPQILGIIAPREGGFPELNIARTKIHPTNSKPKDLATIVQNDYARIGIKDVKVTKTVPVQISSQKSDQTFIFPGVLITYSRSGINISSLVAWIPLKDSDLVVTTKHNADIDNHVEKEWPLLVSALRLDEDSLQPGENTDYSNQSAWLVATALIALLGYMLTAIQRSKRI